jgi:hypothetical protein
MRCFVAYASIIGPKTLHAIRESSLELIASSHLGQSGCFYATYIVLGFESWSIMSWEIYL